jgi:hypothetical protein
MESTLGTKAVIGCFGFGEIGEIALKIIKRNRGIDIAEKRGAGVVFKGVLQAIPAVSHAEALARAAAEFLVGVDGAESRGS